MNIILIDCKKDSDGSFRHTVFKCGHINYKPHREIIFDKFLDEVIGPEYVKEFVKDPVKFVAQYEG